jgi:hypothetical protein
MRLASASVLIAPLAIIVLFGSCLVGKDRLGFRDVGHFYTPLYQYVADRQSEELVPLWNPLDQTGIPLAGETTTAVFYPLRFVVFALLTDAETAMTWYVVLHLILASLTAWTAARWAGASTLAAAIGGAMYALSGSIFFLYTNPPFLIGAAWLPAVLGACLCRVGPERRDRIAIASVCLAMMVLGGDPQTALHAVLTIAAVTMIRVFRRTPTSLTHKQLLGIPIVAALLAAPQIAASVDWGRHSDRVHQQEPDEPWWSPPVVGSARYQAFEYSLPPWHTVELLTPNAFGQLFPENRRVSRLIPGDGRMWTPSLYMGVLAAIGIVASLLRVRSEGVQLWTAIAMVSLLLSMGHFGLVWWIQAATGGLDGLDSAIGGPTWWLYKILPGYASFRYPGKWLSIFAFAVSMTTAHWIDGDLRRDSGRMAKWIVMSAVIVLLAIPIASTLIPANDREHWAELGADVFWGPLQWDSFVAQLQGSLIHSLVSGVIVAGALWLHHRGAISRQRMLWSLLIVTVADTSFAARHLLLPVPRQTEQRLIGRLQTESGTPSSASRWLRTQSGNGWPRSWAETESPLRGIEVEASSRAAWFGRWHLEHRQAVFNNMISIQSDEMHRFWQVFYEICRDRTSEDQRRCWSAMRRWLELNGVLHTSSGATRVLLDGEELQLVDRTFLVDEPLGELTIHHRWTVEQGSTNHDAMRRRLIEVMESDGRSPPALQSTGGSIDALARGESLAHPGPVIDAIRIDRSSESADDPESAMYRVELDRPALLTRVVYQDGNWKARVRSMESAVWIDTEVHRVDYLQQGIVLPSGRYELRFDYQPWWRLPSIILSLAAFSLVAVSLRPRGRIAP